jgi:predicted amidohydrolase
LAHAYPDQPDDWRYRRQSRTNARRGAEAATEGAQIVVFPELSLSGYYPGDLLDEPGFLGAIETGLQNALLVLHQGNKILRYAKQLLQTYNIFDERRHFERGPDVARILKIGTTRIGS